MSGLTLYEKDALGRLRRGRVSGNTQGILNNILLREHPADDDELLDEAFLIRVGFKGDFHKHGPGMWLPGTELKCNWEFQWSWKYTSLSPMTRGDLRRTCELFGIELRSTP